MLVRFEQILSAITLKVSGLMLGGGGETQVKQERQEHQEHKETKENKRNQ